MNLQISLICRLTESASVLSNLTVKYFQVATLLFSFKLGTLKVFTRSLNLFCIPCVCLIFMWDNLASPLSVTFLGACSLKESIRFQNLDTSTRTGTVFDIISETLSVIRVCSYSKDAHTYTDTVEGAKRYSGRDFRLGEISIEKIRLNIQKKVLVWAACKQTWRKSSRVQNLLLIFFLYVTMNL